MKAAVSSTVSVERSISFSVQRSLMQHCCSQKLTWLTFGFTFLFAVLLNEMYSVHFSGIQKLRRKIFNEEK